MPPLPPEPEEPLEPVVVDDAPTLVDVELVEVELATFVELVVDEPPIPVRPPVDPLASGSSKSSAVVPTVPSHAKNANASRNKTRTLNVELPCADIEAETLQKPHQRAVRDPPDPCRSVFASAYGAARWHEPCDTGAHDR